MREFDINEIIELDIPVNVEPRNAWGEIVGDINNQTDLKNALDSKLDTDATIDASKIDGLSVVATTNDYNDLNNKPSIPSVDGLASEEWVLNKHYLTEHQSLSDYAKKSEIPTRVGQLTNDANYSTTAELNLKQDKLVSGTSIKTINGNSLLGSGNIVIQGGSGGTSNYTELSNKPKINNVELNGNKTLEQLGINIPVVPTKVSAFTNDAGYLTQHQSLSEYAKKSELPVVPTNISAFTNDSGYVTSSAIPTKLSQLENDMFIECTQAEYDAIVDKGNKFYFIKD